MGASAGAGAWQLSVISVSMGSESLSLDKKAMLIL